MECVTESIPYTATSRRARRALPSPGGVCSDREPDPHRDNMRIIGHRIHEVFGWILSTPRLGFRVTNINTCNVPRVSSRL